MILVLFPSQPSAEERAAAACVAFADRVHGCVPNGHTIELRHDGRMRRGICGDHGRRVPTDQGLCPVCGGYLHDADEIARLVANIRWAEAHDLPYDAGAVQRMREKPRAANHRAARTPLSPPT